MQNYLAAWAILLCCLTGCSPGQPGSGVMQTEDREVDRFRNVSVEAYADVSIRVGEPQSVSISFDDNLVERVVTRVRNEQLTISVRGRYSSSLGLKVDICVPQLDGYYSYGSSKASIRDVDSESFEVHINGAGSIDCQGTAGTLNVRIAGSGDMDLSELVVREADVSITGSGDIEVHATQRVSANISGSGEVRVHGDPPVMSEWISGSGDVRKVQPAVSQDNED
jgi:hypothetical protein